MSLMTPLALALMLAADPFSAFLEGPPAITSAGRPTEGSRAVAVGDGIVTDAGAAHLVVEHSLYDNHERRTLSLRYDGVKPSAAEGTVVKKGATLGRGAAKVTWRVDGVASSRAEVRSKPRFDPRAEERLVLVDHETYEMRVYERGVEVERFKIGFGQAKGVKEVQGDLKTPKGMYFVTNKHRGAFGGKWGEYYGGHWIKISYPNPWDADRGLDDGFITQQQAREITSRWRRRELPTQKTKLGGGIGFHGWIGPWDDDDPHLTWGCIVMHNPDIKGVYDDIPVGAMVVVF
jgi:hypothetical protein